VTITAGLLLGGRLLLEQLADADDRLAGATATADAAANADDMLRRLVLQADRPSIGRPFTGGPNRARFASWCDTPAGWEEACTVTLALGRTLRVNAPPLRPFVARRGLTGAELRYLRDATDGGQWERTWGSDVAVPLAIGVITDRDTTIFRIGERG
jgi:hypothetical protein